MSALLASMGLVVVIYYWWPAGAVVISSYATWQQAGGILRAGLVAGFAGGILSELSTIYFSDRGRWNARHVENMAFRSAVFSFGGLIVYIFYRAQAVWFGDGLAWQVILPKVLVDQFIFTVFWSTPYQTVTFRWQVLRYSLPSLWKELDGSFIIERMLPVLVTNWMFWIPGVVLIYSTPLILQMPLNVFATAIWSLLLAGVARPLTVPAAEMGPGLVLAEPAPVAESVK